ncbi:MAG: hypothetical protein GXX87_04485 [Euryarchaeota archaeon]|jgi:hypothetical protein|nr:hypothetical protein [Euryarchaeota archaeon]
MAKKKRVVEEPKEEYEFKPEAFDEREFIYKDIHGTKILGVISVIAILFGIASAAMCSMSGIDWMWIPVTFMSFALMFALKRILLVLRFRPDLLDGKTMYANYFLFLCLALGFCVVFVNPPFFG